MTATRIIDEAADREQRQSQREFRRLRNFYRRHYAHGDSDECFVLWVEVMCKREGGDGDPCCEG